MIRRQFYSYIFLHRKGIKPCAFIKWELVCLQRFILSHANRQKAHQLITIRNIQYLCHLMAYLILVCDMSLIPAALIPKLNDSKEHVLYRRRIILNCKAAISVSNFPLR